MSWAWIQHHYMAMQDLVGAEFAADFTNPDKFLIRFIPMLRPGHAWKPIGRVIRIKNVSSKLYT